MSIPKYDPKVVFEIIANFRQKIVIRGVPCAASSSNEVRLFGRTGHQEVGVHPCGRPERLGPFLTRGKRAAWPYFTEAYPRCADIMPTIEVMVLQASA